MAKSALIFLSSTLEMKIGAHLVPEIEGVDMDKIMDAFQQGVTGKIVDVVDEVDGEHVEIFIE